MEDVQWRLNGEAVPEDRYVWETQIYIFKKLIFMREMSFIYRFASRPVARMGGASTAQAEEGDRNADGKR